MVFRSSGIPGRPQPEDGRDGHPPKDRGERSRRYWPATVSREIFSVGEAV